MSNTALWLDFDSEEELVYLVQGEDQQYKSSAAEV